MKRKLILGTAALAAIFFAGIAVMQGEGEKVTVFTPKGVEERSADSLPRFDAEESRRAGAAAAEIAAAPESKPEDLSGLAPAELEARVKAIDSQIEGGRLVERANGGELSVGELTRLRILLEQRNRLLLRKIDLDLNDA